jgi:hypothetical protein
MTVTAAEIDLTQWTDSDLREDVRRCMNALSLLTEGSPAHAGLARNIASTVSELQRRSPAVAGQARATVCRCGEVLITTDDATVHFVEVFIPDNNVGHDGRIHEEITLPGSEPARWECPVPAPGHGTAPCEDGCREAQI